MTDQHPPDSGTPVRPDAGGIPPELRAEWQEIIREAVRLEVGAARPRFITKEDVAAMLSVSPRHVDNLVQRGELPARYVGTSLRFSVDAVEAFMRKLPRTSQRKSRKAGRAVK